jgi:L-malate glycosyltransferase
MGSRSRRHTSAGEMPHVLFLIDRLHSTEGGAESALLKLCQFLPAYGFRCSVATFWAGDNVDRQFPCPVHVFRLARTYDWTALRQALAFASLLRTERVEILHTFFPASDLWGGVVAWASGCPILISSRRDMGILHRPKHRLPYAIANRFFDQVQAVSDNVREFCITREHIPAEKVFTVYNGVDLETIDKAMPTDPRVSRGWAADSPVVVTIANIRFVKGIDILVEAAALVRNQVPQGKFLVIGAAVQEPEYETKLRRAVSRLDLEQHFAFFGMRRDVISLLKRSDIFCLASRSEGMSNALLEAMACGLPCVATDVGGNSEVVQEGQTGFLVASEDPYALASRIIELLSNRTRTRQLGEQGRRLVEARFSVHHMAERVRLLYLRLLTERGRVLPAFRELPVPSQQR